MTLSHIGLITAVALLAASEAVPNGLLDPIARLGAVTTLGTALLLMLYRTIPNMSKAFGEELAAQREYETKRTDKLAKALDDLRIHCATKNEGK